MWEKLIENKTTQLFERSLDASAIRNRLLAHNVANVNTPFYKRLDIDFKSILDETVAKNKLEITRTHPAHFGNLIPEIGAPRVTRETKTTERYDQNNIDPEFEMAQITENNLYFQSLSRRLNGKFTSLKTVIQGR